MAYLSETPEWGTGIYQLESTDPAGGGPNGILNLPMKTAANRLAYLKQYADEVGNARGGYSNLKARFDSLTPIDEANQNANMGAILEALGLAGLANREIQKERTQRKQTGIILLANKGIISGCTVTKSITATRNLSCAAGTVFARGQLFPFFGETDGAAVPGNETQSARTCYAYLYFKMDGTLEFTVTPLGQTVPDNGIPLYLVTIPAGNNEQNDPNLANVTLSSVRRVEANFPAFYSNPLYANVYLPFPLPDNEYAIRLDLISITGSGFQRGEVYPMDRNVNGFKIYYNGVADDLIIRWEISKPSL
jgi:hypothetical protein